MRSDILISQQAVLKPIAEIAAQAGLAAEDIEPYGNLKAKISYAASSYDSLSGADALVILTEWNEFRNPDFSKIKSLLKTPVIFDGRNQYNSFDMDRLGFNYYQVGKV